MDTLCGFGLPELIIVALLAFVLIGPERSRDVALKAGRFLRSVMSSPWWRDFNQVATSIRDLPNTLMRMAELEEAQADIQKTVSDIRDSAQIDPTITGSVNRGRVISENPWGIENAVAQTQFNPSEPPPSESDDKSDDTDAN